MVDLKEEQKYERFRELMQELHLPAYNAFWMLEVRDRNGRLIQRHQQRSRSWTRNAYNHLFSNMCAKNATGLATFGAGEVNFKNTAGTIRGHTAYGSSIYSINTYEGTTAGVKPLAGVDTWGIVVGKGTNAESFEGFALQTQIPHGETSGELSYQAQQAHSVSYTAATKVLADELVRYFNNNSGGSIDVNEVGMVFSLYRPFYTSSGTILFARDRVTVTVPDTGQLKVLYSLQLTYPA